MLDYCLFGGDFCVLLDTELGRAVARYMRRSSSLSENWFLIVTLAGIVAFWIALYYWDQYRRRLGRPGGSPAALFQELCEAHQLDASERALLLQVVESHRLKQPAVVFVDPQWLAATTAHDATACAGLARKLFGPDTAG
jgi:hypothetical protein